MALSRALRSVRLTHTGCVLRQLAHKGFSTTSRLRNAEESRLPRIANPSLWASLVPKPFRRPVDPAEAVERAQQRAEKAARPGQRNPYTIFIVLGVLVGSNAINTIALRNEMLNFSRKTEAKLELLREVVRKVKNGEEVDVKRALGTGDAESEQEWEEVVRELESTDMLWEGKKRREAKKAKDAHEKRAAAEERQALTPEEREGPSLGAASSGHTAQPDHNASLTRPKFMM